MEPSVRKATRADNDRLAATLASAFEDDPLFGWFFPDTRVRRRRLHGFFASTSTRMALPHDETWVNDDITTVAVWIPPERWKMPVSEQLRVLPAFVRWARWHTPRVLATLTKMDQVHPHEPPSWYLLALGTDQEHQGKGQGSAVMSHMLGRADDEGIPAYLESSNPRNIAFYARHGFVERPPIVLGPGKPSLVPMWREPR